MTNTDVPLRPAAGMGVSEVQEEVPGSNFQRSLRYVLPGPMPPKIYPKLPTLNPEAYCRSIPTGIDVPVDHVSFTRSKT